MLPILALSTPMCLRTLNYERAIVLDNLGAASDLMSQNPQLREGYCTLYLFKKMEQVSQNPQLREGYCTSML